MESRRLVVWISAGILGFQGATLAFDLFNCTVLSWLFVRQHGMRVEVPGGQQGRQGPGGSGSRPKAPSGKPQEEPGAPQGSVFDPTGVFCEQPHKRIDAAVGQGLTIRAGLARGSSVAGGGKPGSGGQP
jgi:hypothetical protein